MSDVINNQKVINDIINNKEIREIYLLEFPDLSTYINSLIGEPKSQKPARQLMNKLMLLPNIEQRIKLIYGEDVMVSLSRGGVQGANREVTDRKPFKETIHVPIDEWEGWFDEYTSDEKKRITTSFSFYNPKKDCVVVSVKGVILS